ncbi:hypothetical protein [Nitriliruptor alkaliphilus]|uniref:hypothetical protein n=1 Tax=Nitriliruptor alkaliphilus TaxID=427918 RepID=UPI0006961374|nr:hypothetical protein [Nitriliruptor alkaliphilus]
MTTHDENPLLASLLTRTLPAPSLLTPEALKVRAVVAANKSYAAAADRFTEALDAAEDWPAWAYTEADYTRRVEAAVAAGEPVTEPEPNRTEHLARGRHLAKVAERLFRELEPAAAAVDEAVLANRETIRAAVAERYAAEVQAAADAFEAARVARSRALGTLTSLRALDAAGVYALAGPSPSFETKNAADGVVSRLDAPVHEVHFSGAAKPNRASDLWAATAETVRLLDTYRTLCAEVDPAQDPVVLATIREARDRDAKTATLYAEADARRAASLTERNAEVATR